MKFSPLVHRWLHKFNLSLGLLIVLLQRTPAVRVVVSAAEFVLASPAGNILKSSLATAATLGAVNTLAGATELSPSTPSPAQLTVGTAASISFGILGTISDPESWTVSGSVPPGMTFNGGRTSGTINLAFITLSGTPTTAGTYNLSLTAFDSIGGSSIPFGYTINVTGAANIAPSITTQPQNQTVTVGDNVTFTSGAGGTPAPTLQWQKNGADIGGANSTSLTLFNVQPGDAGNYTLVATNGAGFATSNPATLTVNAAPSAPSFTQHPGGQSVTVGGMATFTAAASGNPAPSYQWQKNGVNIGGAVNGTLTLFNVQLGDAGSYTMVASNGSGSVTSNAATLTVNPAVTPPSFTAQPGNHTVAAGSPVTLTTAASGNPSPTFQWQKNGVNIPGAMSASYTIPSVTADDAGNYAVVASNSAGNVVSNVVTLVVTSRMRGDFNGDGKADILWSNSATGELSMWFMNGNAPSGGAAMSPIPVEWKVSGTGDYNGDGRADILWTNSLTGDRAMWLMNGANINLNAFLTTVPLDWTVSANADFNGDGRADILWSNTVSGDRAIWLMNGNAVDGSSGYLATIPVEWKVAGTGDFNGDGKADILWSNSATGELSMWFMNGSAPSGGAAMNPIPVEWKVSGTGDYNGDGRADILWTNSVTGDRAMWLMNGTSIILNAFLTTVPLDWVVSSNTDYNGDGRADILWSNTISGDRAVWLMNGNVVDGSSGYLATIPAEWQVSGGP